MALAQRLRERHYDVFLDRAEYAGGDDWKKIGEVALRNTHRLVLVATREAVTDSGPVAHEVKMFTGRGGQVIPIVFGERWADGPKPPVFSLLPDTQLYIEEEAANLARGPAEAVVDRLTHTYRVMRRRNLRATLLGVAVAILFGFAALAFVLWINAELSAGSEKAARQQEEKQRRAAERNAYDSLALALASQAVAVQGPTRFPLPPQRAQDERAALLARQAYLFLGKGNGHALPAVDQALRTVLGAPYFSTLLPGRDGPDFSRDGSRLAVIAERRVEVWGIPGPTSAPVATLPTVPTVVCFGADNSSLLCGDEEGAVALWDLGRPSSHLQRLLEHQGKVRTVVGSPTGKRAISVSSDGAICVWDLSGGKLTLRQKRAVKADGRAGFIDSDDYFVYETADKKWTGVDLTSSGWREVPVMEREKALPPGRAFALDPSGEVLALDPSSGHIVFSSRGKLGVRRITSPEFAVAYGASGQVSDSRITWALYCPKSDQLFAASDNLPSWLTVWEKERGKLDRKRTQLSPAGERPIATSPGGDYLVTRAQHGLRIWNVRRTPESPRYIPWPTIAVDEAAYAPESDTLLWTGFEGRTLYSCRGGDKTTVETAFPGGVSGRTNAIEVARGGKRAAIALTGGHLVVVDLSTLPQAKIHTHRIATDQISFSPDGDRIAFSSGGSVFVCPAEGPAKPVPVPSLETVTRYVCLRLTASGLTGLTLGGDVVRWGSLSSDAVPEVLLNVYRSAGHVDPLNAVGQPSLRAAFSDDGLALAVAFGVSGPGRVYQWDLDRKSLFQTRPTGHEHGVSTLAFGAGDRLLCSGGTDGTIQVWRTRMDSGPVVLRTTTAVPGIEDPVWGIENRVFRVALDAGGQRLTALTRMGVISWSTDTGALADRVAGVVRRNLTREEWREYVSRTVPYELTCPDIPED